MKTEEAWLMVCRLTVYDGDHVTYIDANKGDHLLSLLKENEIPIDSTCNGNVTCGRCKVIATGLVGTLTEQEMALLSPEEVERGVRLACMVRIDGNAKVYLIKE